MKWERESASLRWNSLNTSTSFFYTDDKMILCYFFFFFLLDSNLCCHLTPAMYIPIQFFSACKYYKHGYLCCTTLVTLINIDNDDISSSSSTNYRIQKYVYAIMFIEEAWLEFSGKQIVLFKRYTNVRLSTQLFGWATMRGSLCIIGI